MLFVVDVVASLWHVDYNKFNQVPVSSFYVLFPKYMLGSKELLIKTTKENATIEIRVQNVVSRHFDVVQSETSSGITVADVI